MSQKLVQQCLIQKGNTEEVAWIESCHAKSGKMIKIKQDDGVWEDGWKVVIAYDTQKPYEWIRARSHDDKKWRDVTDL